MGTTSTREKIESKMLKLKLRRVEIKQERIERVNQLEKITGKEIIREPIPDYIDHSEDEINPEDIDNEEEEIEEEIIHTKKNKKSKKKKKYEEEEEDDDSEYDKRVKNKLKRSKTTKSKKNKRYDRQATKQY